MDERVTIAIEGGVADVRLARPDKLNAFDLAMFDAINAAIERIGAVAAVRCVVLSGEGRAFSVGLDLDTLAEAELGDFGERRFGIANRFQQVAWGWRQLPQPVIAAVHGFALGAGFQLMLGADIRLAAPVTEVAAMEARWGLVPDMAGVALMRGLVREDIARELTYTARRIGSAEALALGLVTRIVDDPRAAALDLARRIAANSPDAVRAAKRLFNRWGERDAETILRAEAAEQAALIGTRNQRETIAAAREKRPPLFRDVA